MSAKKTIDFSDMTQRDFAALLMNTAVTGRDTNNDEIIIRNGKINGTAAIIIAIPRYKFADGKVVANQPVVANSSAAAS